MMLTNPVNISFQIPPADSLAREEILGKILFLSDNVELSWRLKGNVFSGGKGKMQVIDLLYGEIEHVDLVKKWFKIRQIVFRVSDPRLLAGIPAAEMGKLTMIIDDRSREEVKKLHGLIDFKRSIFLFDAQEERLKAMRKED